jgi:hypothetical protein
VTESASISSIGKKLFQTCANKGPLWTDLCEIFSNFDEYITRVGIHFGRFFGKFWSLFPNDSGRAVPNQQISSERARAVGNREQFVEQDDQIRRFFAQWAIVYFGRSPENYRRAPHIYVTLCHG